MVKTVCQTCGKEFEGWPYAKRKFCSHPCFCLSRKNQTKTICKRCRKVFFDDPSGRRIFCSNKCSHDYKHGVNHSNWKGGISKAITPATCLVCGKSFKVRQWVKKAGFGKFCSHTCRTIYQLKHQRKKRTSIEVKVKEYLDRLGIAYEEQKVIPEGRTVADFYIPAQRIVLYADGVYWHNRPGIKDKDQNQDFLLGMNGYKVLRLGETEIKLKQELCLEKIRRAVK